MDWIFDAHELVPQVIITLLLNWNTNKTNIDNFCSHPTKAGSIALLAALRRSLI